MGDDAGGALSASGGPGGALRLRRPGGALRLRRSGGALSASGGPPGAPGRADNPHTPPAIPRNPQLTPRRRFRGIHKALRPAGRSSSSYRSSTSTSTYARTDSNRRPDGCKPSALPTELRACNPQATNPAPRRHAPGRVEDSVMQGPAIDFGRSAGERRSSQGETWRVSSAVVQFVAIACWAATS